MSENRVSITAKVPLTAQQQWETFIADHLRTLARGIG
jgi:hypothetical protein